MGRKNHRMLPDAYSYGIFIRSSASTGVTERVTVQNSYVNGRGSADVIGGGPADSIGTVREVTLQNNTVKQNASLGDLYQGGIVLVKVDRMKILNNHIEGNVVFGVEQYPTTHSIISGNTVAKATGQTCAALGISASASATNPDSFLIFTNNTLDNGYVDILANVGNMNRDFQVTGNTINATGCTEGILLQKVRGGVVANNTIASSTDRGIEIVDSSNVAVANNVIRNSTNFGITSSGTSNGNSYLGNILTNNPTLYSLVDTTSSTTVKGGFTVERSNGATPLLVADSNSNEVGIMTNTPGATLDVNGVAHVRDAIFADDLLHYNGGATPLIIGASDELVVRDDTNRIGMGTSSPVNKLTVSGGNVEGISIWSTNAPVLDFYPGGGIGSRNFRMAINYNANDIFEILRSSTVGGAPTTNAFTLNGTNGFVGIGTTSPSKFLSVQGDFFASGTTTTGILTATSTVYFPALGTVLTGNALCINATTGRVTDSGDQDCDVPSSIRFKENVQDLSYGLAEVLKLRPVSFNYKPEMNIEGPQLGFIAEDVNEVLPEIVEKDAEGNPTGMSATKLISPLTNAVQELWGMIQKLTARVSGLEKKLNDQQKQIDTLEARLEKLEAAQ